MQAMITIKSILQSEGDREETELATKGSYRFSRECSLLRYEESEATGFFGAVTEVRVEEHCVTITRTGEVQSSLVLEPGKKHFCHYAMPFGEMTIGVSAHALSNTLDAQGGMLSMHYTIDLFGSVLSENEITLTVKPV